MWSIVVDWGPRKSGVFCMWGLSGTGRKCEYLLLDLNGNLCGKAVVDGDPGNGEFRRYSGPSRESPE